MLLFNKPSQTTILHQIIFKTKVLHVLEKTILVKRL